MKNWQRHAYKTSYRKLKTNKYKPYQKAGVILGGFCSTCDNRYNDKSHSLMVYSGERALGCCCDRCNISVIIYNSYIIYYQLRKYTAYVVFAAKLVHRNRVSNLEIGVIAYVINFFSQPTFIDNFLQVFTVTLVYCFVFYHYVLLCFAVF